MEARWPARILNLDDLSRFKGHRFPRTVIGYAARTYHSFALSPSDVEGLLAERGIIMPHEPTRVQVAKVRYDRPRLADR